MDSKRLKNTHYPNSDDKKINIKYNIPLINFKGYLNDTIYNVTSNLINILQTKIISKHTDCDYYIHGDINDHLPSPFSNSKLSPISVESISSLSQSNSGSEPISLNCLACLNVSK